MLRAHDAAPDDAAGRAAIEIPARDDATIRFDYGRARAGAPRCRLRMSASPALSSAGDMLRMANETMTSFHHRAAAFICKRDTPRARAGRRQQNSAYFLRDARQKRCDALGHYFSFNASTWANTKRAHLLLKFHAMRARGSFSAHYFVFSLVS